MMNKKRKTNANEIEVNYYIKKLLLLKYEKTSEFACKAQKRNKTLEVTQRRLFEYIVCIPKCV